MEERRKWNALMDRVKKAEKEKQYKLETAGRVIEARERSNNRAQFLIDQRKAKIKLREDKEKTPYRKNGYTPTKKPNTGQEQFFKGLRSFILNFQDDDKSFALLEKVFYHHGIFCPYCGCDDNKKIHTFPEDKYQHKCNECKKKFKVTARTIFDNTKIPRYKTLGIILCEIMSRGGATIKECGKYMEVSSKTAHERLTAIRRYGFDQDIFQMIMRNPEAYGFENMPKPGKDDPFYIDTTVMDGLERNRPKHKKRGGKGGPLFAEVLNITQKNGYAQGVLLPDLINDGIKKSLLMMVRELIPLNSIVYSDSAATLVSLRDTHRYDKVNHKNGEYSRGKVTTNPVEGLNAEVKVQSEKHQNRFAREGKALFVNAVMFRQNTRFLNNSDILILVLTIMANNLLPIKVRKAKVVQMNTNLVQMDNLTGIRKAQ